MWLRSDSFEPGGPIPPRFAMGKYHADVNATFSENVNPHLSWGDLPVGTESLALIMVDTQAPSVRDDVNKPGCTVPHDLPRADFYHWVLVDIDPSIEEIATGSHAMGVVVGGKSAQLPEGSVGVASHGRNSYTEWFAGDAAMAGNYFGYDGPFPPWNDERTHEYEFTLYALDSPLTELSDPFAATHVLAAMRDHVLDSVTLTGTYRINPN